jgi:hypothetical protein
MQCAIAAADENIRALLIYNSRLVIHRTSAYIVYMCLRTLNG